MLLLLAACSAVETPVEPGWEGSAQQLGGTALAPVVVLTPTATDVALLAEVEPAEFLPPSHSDLMALARETFNGNQAVNTFLDSCQQLGEKLGEAGFTLWKSFWCASVPTWSQYQETHIACPDSGPGWTPTQVVINDPNKVGHNFAGVFCFAQ